MLLNYILVTKQSYITKKASVDTLDKNKCDICVKKLLRSSKVLICSVCEVTVHTECANYDDGSVSAYKCEKCSKNSSVTSIETVIDNHASGESYKEWINDNRKKSRRNSQNAIIGSAKNMCSVKAAPKKVSQFVTLLQPGTKSEDLVTFLRKMFPEAVCEEITPKHPESYASFKIAVLSCYRSPINQNFRVFCEKLDQILEENFDSSTNFIFCRDFNVDPNRDENNYKILINFLESYGLKNTVHDKTQLKQLYQDRKIEHTQLIEGTKRLYYNK
nr:unnamed protein product [Callosobruchus analis]